MSSAPAILLTNVSQIQTNIFNKLTGANGSVYSAQSFRYYLQKGFSPYHGTQSMAPQGILGGPSGLEVKNIFFTPTGDNDPDADAATFNGKTQRRRSSILIIVTNLGRG
jgi:hypothetical protein